MSDFFSQLSLKVFNYNSALANEPWVLKPKQYFQRFYYIKGGDAWYIDKTGQRIPFVKGKIYIMPYFMDCNFQHDPQNPCDHVFIDFLSAPIIRADSPIVYDVSKDSTVYRLIMMVEAISRKLIPYTDYRVPEVTRNVRAEERKMVCSLLKTILILCHHEKRLPFAEDSYISDVVKYIHDHCHEPITNEQLSQQVHLSKNHFIERFSSFMGITPYAYLKKYRLAKAKTYLSRGESLSEVAEKTGYQTASALSKALKNER